MQKTDTRQSTGKKSPDDASKKRASRQGRNVLNNDWMDGKNRDIVVYYLMAVAFLELIVGVLAFFYGVMHPSVSEEGIKMASFPWVGWLIGAILSPVGLLLLLHLSGQFFSRSLNGGMADSRAEGVSDKDGRVPERVQRFYTIMHHAPTIVILLGLIIFGGALFFLDSALDMVVQMGKSIVPYLPWIIGSITVFLILCYLARLMFLSHQHRMEREYAYRMQVFEKTGVILASRGCTPMRIKDGELQKLNEGDSVTTALPPADSGADATQESVEKNNPEQTSSVEDDITDATVVDLPEETPKYGKPGAVSES